MNWIFSLEELQNSMLSRLDTPPYFLMVIGVFFLLTSGIAFLASVLIQTSLWRRNLVTERSTRWLAMQLLIPFAGVASGLSILLSAILMGVGLPILPSCLFALAITAFFSAYLWWSVGQRIGNRMVKFYLAQQL